MAKVKVKARTVFGCTSCGHVEPRWLGRCPACQDWNTLVEHTAYPAATTAARSAGPGAWFVGERAAPMPITEVSEISASDRLSTEIAELDRVLGGGLVAGSLVLLGGEPGVGKSTLLIQALAG